MIGLPAQAVPVVLLVDDNPDDRFKISWMLSQERQVMFHEAASVDEGIQQWQAVKPDLVLLDLRLPDGDGSEVLRRAREGRWGNPIVVIVSELSLPQRVDDLRGDGAQHFLPKEILTRALLGGVIDSATRRVQLRNERKRAQQSIDAQLTALRSQLEPALVELKGLGSGQQAAHQADLPAVRLLKGVAAQHADAIQTQLDHLASWVEIDAGYDAGPKPWGEVSARLSALAGPALHWSTEVDSDVEVSIDATRLDCALTELVANALRFDRPVAVHQARLLASATHRGHEVCLTLRTQHPRISPVWQYQPEQLFRLGVVANSGGDNTAGVGLAKVARVLADSNISIALSIDARQGFSLRLGIPATTAPDALSNLQES